MSTQYVTRALYKFVALPHFRFRHLLKVMTDNQVYGTLLLASEGTCNCLQHPKRYRYVVAWLNQQPLENIDNKESYDDKIPYRTKVKLKKK